MNINIRSYAANTPQANAMIIEVSGYNLYFSYQTIVAVEIPGAGLFVRKNDWGVTTGKHLNLIDGGDKQRRLPSDEFEALLESIEITCNTVRQ